MIPSCLKHSINVTDKHKERTFLCSVMHIGYQYSNVRNLKKSYEST